MDLLDEALAFHRFLHLIDALDDAMIRIYEFLDAGDLAFVFAGDDDDRVSCSQFFHDDCDK